MIAGLLPSFRELVVRGGALWPGAALVVACAAPSAPRTDPQSPRDSSEAPARETTTEEQAAHPPPPPEEHTPDSNETPGRFEPLAVDGQEDALLWIPRDSGKKLPLFVVAHGAGGSPEWHCEFWSQVVGDGAFLLCLRGRSLGAGADAYYFPEHHSLERWFAAAVEQFDQVFSARVLRERSVYIGYSQGATMGALMLSKHAARFSRALYMEGGFDYWSLSRAREFQRAGGEAVFIACGTTNCERKGQNVVTWLEKSGVRAQMTHARGAGHTPAGEVGVIAIEGLGWLLSP